MPAKQQMARERTSRLITATGVLAFGLILLAATWVAAGPAIAGAAWLLPLPGIAFLVAGALILMGSFTGGPGPLPAHHGGCQACGRYTPGAARFCASCGTALR